MLVIAQPTDQAEGWCHLTTFSLPGVEVGIILVHKQWAEGEQGGSKESGWMMFHSSAATVTLACALGKMRNEMHSCSELDQLYQRTFIGSPYARRCPSPEAG